MKAAIMVLECPSSNPCSAPVVMAVGTNSKEAVPSPYSISDKCITRVRAFGSPTSYPLKGYGKHDEGAGSIGLPASGVAQRRALLLQGYGHCERDRWQAPTSVPESGNHGWSNP